MPSLAHSSAPPLPLLQNKGKLLKKRGATIAATRERRAPPAKRLRLASGAATAGAGAARNDGDTSDEYASEGEVQATAEDLAFIDEEDDDAELLAEYKRDRQDFNDEAPTRIGGRGNTKKPKKRASAADDELDDDEGMGGALAGPGAKKGAMRASSSSKKLGQIEEADQVRMVSELFADMTAAARADVAAREAGQPAVSKLRMLDRLRMVTAIGALHSKLLEGTATGAGSLGTTQVTLLHLFRAWLRPSPSGDLPPLPLRECIYEIMDKLPISTYHLRDSRVGEVLFALSHDGRETEKNRALLGAMVERFSRAIFQKSAQYRGGMADVLARQAEIAERNKRALGSAAGAAGGAGATSGGAAARAGATSPSAPAPAAGPIALSKLAEADLGALLGAEDDEAEGAGEADGSHAGGAGGPGGVAAARAAAAADRRIPAPMVFDFTVRPQAEDGLAPLRDKKQKSEDSRRGALAKRMDEVRKAQVRGIERGMKVSIEGRGTT